MGWVIHQHFDASVLSYANYIGKFDRIKAINVLKFAIRKKQQFEKSKTQILQ